MPKIPIYGEPQVSLGGRPQQTLSGQEIQQIGYWAGGQMARQGEEMMQSAQRLMGIEIQRQRDEAAIEFEKKRSEFDVAWASVETAAKEQDSANRSKYNNIGYGGESAKDPNTYYNKSVASFEKLMQDDRFKSNNQFTQQAWEKWSVAKFADVKVAAIKHEAAQRVAARQQQVADAIANDSTIALANPDRVPEIIAKWDAILKGDAKDASGAPLPNYANVVGQAWLRNARDNLGKIIAVPAFEKMVIDDPRSAYVILNKMREELKLDPSAPLDEINAKVAEKSLMRRWGLDNDDFLRLYSKAQSAVSAVNSYDVFKLKREVDNHLALLTTGGAGDPRFKTKQGLAAVVAKVYDPFSTKKGGLTDQASMYVDEAWSNITVARKVFNITSQIKFASMQQINDTLNRLQPKGETAAEDLKIRTAVISNVQAMLQQRNDDLVGYANSHPNVVKLIKEGDIRGAREQSIALQLQMGAQPYEVGVLSAAERAAEINFFNKAEGNDVIQRLRDFELRFGGRNPDGSFSAPGQLAMAWRALTTGSGALDPSWQFASRALGTAYEKKVFDALRANPEILRSNLGKLTATGTSYEDVKDQVLVNSQPVRTALTGGLNARDYIFEGARELMVKLAANEIIASGGSVNTRTAVKNAINAVTESFDIKGGTYFIPRARTGFPHTYNHANIHKNAEYLKTIEGLNKNFVLVPPGSLDKGVDNQTTYRATQYAKTVASYGYWINSDDGSGLMLMVKTGSGPQPVMSTTGIITIDFNSLSKQTTTPFDKLTLPPEPGKPPLGQIIPPFLQSPTMQDRTTPPLFQ